MFLTELARVESRPIPIGPKLISLQGLPVATAPPSCGSCLATCNARITKPVSKPRRCVCKFSLPPPSPPAGRAYLRMSINYSSIDRNHLHCWPAQAHGVYEKATEKSHGSLQPYRRLNRAAQAKLEYLQTLKLEHTRALLVGLSGPDEDAIAGTQV